MITTVVRKAKWLSSWLVQLLSRVHRHLPVLVIRDDTQILEDLRRSGYQVFRGDVMLSRASTQPTHGHERLVELSNRLSTMAQLLSNRGLMSTFSDDERQRYADEHAALSRIFEDLEIWPGRLPDLEARLDALEARIGLHDSKHASAHHEMHPFP